MNRALKYDDAPTTDSVTAMNESKMPRNVERKVSFTELQYRTRNCDRLDSIPLRDPSWRMVIETPRLFLREFTLDDLEGYFQLGATPALVRYIGGRTLASREEARQLLINATLRDYTIHGYGRLACIEKATGALIGFCGLKNDPKLGEIDIGYRFLESSWGRGFATESARAVLAHGCDVLGLRRIVGVVDPANTASVRVLRKLGLVFEKQVRYADGSDLYDLYA